MKRMLTGVMVLLLGALAVAQESGQAQPAPPAAPQVKATNLRKRVQAPTYSDLNCSGFITKQGFSRDKYVTAGYESPDASMMGQTDVVFLSGTGYQENQLFTILRPLRDPNQYEPFVGQRKLIEQSGQPYAELGRVRITQVRESQAIAKVEFSCDAISPGDLVVPLQEHPAVSYRKEKVGFNEFPTSGKQVGRILMSKEFDMFVAVGQKVYINAGAEQGIKVGDYLRVMRGYDPAEMDAAQALSYKSPVGVDTQKNPPKITKAELDRSPRRALGEMIILTVTPTSATGMITLSVDAIKVGDAVESETP